MQTNPTPTSEHQQALAVRQVRAQVELGKAKYISMWWDTPTDLPILGPTYTRREKRAKERDLEAFLKTLTNRLEDVPLFDSEQLIWRDEVKQMITTFARQFLDWPQGYLDILFMDEYSQVTNQFIEDARTFDPAIRVEDVFQAIRNVWIANSIQILMGRSVALTPGLFAYSMLYPYSDNYLDDPSCSTAVKAEFNRRFTRSLKGEPVEPASPLEGQIFDLVRMIEGEFPRPEYRGVYESLLAIHHAQEKSLLQQRGHRSPFETNILDISFEKGGTSVLADGYLAAGRLTPREADFMMGYGIFLQLVDDLEDVEDDLRNAHMTLYSQTAKHWPLDAVTGKLFQFMAQVLKDADHFTATRAEIEKGLIQAACSTLIIEQVGKTRKLYSREFIKQIESYSPIHFAFSEKLHKKLRKKYPALTNLAFILSNSAAISFAVPPRKRKIFPPMVGPFRKWNESGNSEGMSI